MKSIHVYLIAVLLSIICLVNFLAALHGYRSSMAAGEALLDRMLADEVDMLVALLDEGQGLPADLFQHNQLFQVWTHDGHMVYRSTLAPAFPLSHRRSGHAFINHDGLRWRSLVRPVGSNRTLLVAQRYDWYALLIEDVLLTAILPIVWVVPLLGLLIWFIIHYGMSPMRRLADQLSGRHETDFSPLSRKDAPQELHVMVDSINDLMARLEAVFEREKRFTADAAHELKTPLTSIRLGIENLRAGFAPQQTQDLLDDVEQSAQRMQITIDQLLALYRMTPEAFAQGCQWLSPAELARQAVVDMYPRFEARGQRIELEGQSSDVLAYPFALQVVLRNLLDNANKYTPEGGKVKVTLWDESPTSVCLSVEDSGPGISEQECERVLERFYRVGGDRHASGTVGSGLGLSIVKQVADLHQARLELGVSPVLKGLKITLCVPVSSRQGESS